MQKSIHLPVATGLVLQAVVAAATIAGVTVEEEEEEEILDLPMIEVVVLTIEMLLDILLVTGTEMLHLHLEENLVKEQVLGMVVGEMTFRLLGGLVLGMMSAKVEGLVETERTMVEDHIGELFACGSTLPRMLFRISCLLE
jgi:hypothetical protein